MSNIISKKQSAIYFSILMVLVLYDINVAISWIIVILVMGNVRRIKCNNWFTHFIRKTGYFAVYLVPIVTGAEMEPLFRNEPRFWIAFFGGISVGCMIFIRDIMKCRILYSDEGVAAMCYSSKIEIFSMIYVAVGAAVSEEIYFRGYLVRQGDLWLTNLVVSSILFVASHYFLPWSKAFSWKDYMRQFCVGMISGIILLFSKSIFPCFCLHLLCNGNRILVELRRFERYYINSKKYDEFIRKDSEIDVDF